MGINSLNSLVKRHAANAYFELPITKLAGKRIAIDAYNWMYTYIAIARKKVITYTDVTVAEPDVSEIRREWFAAAIDFILQLLVDGITPIFVFDGESPVEKDGTQAKRRAAKVAARAKIEALQAQVKQALQVKQDNSAAIVEALRKELRNYVTITEEDSKIFQTVLTGIGIPCLQAASEGEQLCSMLCADGIVAAVYSVDTDNLAYGCPLLITGFSQNSSRAANGDRIRHLDCVRLDYILAGLALDHVTFVDLCIMCGCDHNTNMPGIAAIKSYALIKQYGTIDKLPVKHDITCLLHKTCRRLFSYVPSQDLIVGTVPLYDINLKALDTAAQHLQAAGTASLLGKITAVYQIVKPSSAGYIVDLQLQPLLKYVPVSDNIAVVTPVVTPSVTPRIVRLNIIYKSTT